MLYRGNALTIDYLAPRKLTIIKKFERNYECANGICRNGFNDFACFIREESQTEADCTGVDPTPVPILDPGVFPHILGWCEEGPGGDIDHCYVEVRPSQLTTVPGILETNCYHVLRGSAKITSAKMGNVSRLVEFTLVLLKRRVHVKLTAQAWTLCLWRLRSPTLGRRLPPIYLEGVLGQTINIVISL